MRRITVLLVLAFAAAACGPSAEEQAAAAAAAADAAQDSIMAEASAAFDQSVYDTLTWESDQARADRGAQVYNFSCTKCHGDEGLGDAGFVLGGDTLRPPSFREPTWAMAGDLEAIRNAIFVGTKRGMPHWGLEGLKAEAVDAVARYVMNGPGGD